MQDNKWIIDVLLNLAIQADALGFKETYRALIDASVITSCEISSDDLTLNCGDHADSGTIIPLETLAHSSQCRG